jgi:hypothetical protein
MTADDRRPVPLPPHPDLDTLADLHAGALDGSGTERLRTHVSSCAQCAEVLAALDTVEAELHGLHERSSPPMPAAVAARLDATLADLRRGQRPAAAAAGRPGPVRSDASTSDPAGGLDHTPSGHPGSAAARSGAPATAGTGAGSTETAADLAAARERRRRRLARSLGAVAAAVAVIAAGASVTALVRAGGGSDNATSAAAGAPDKAGSGADSAGQAAPAESTRNPGPSIAIPAYDRDTLRAALPSIARNSAVGIVTGRGDTGPAGAMADPARRTACVGTIRASRGQLQAVQRIRYEGMPAYVFVFDDDGERTGFVVSDECGTASALSGSVLDTVS